jgi:hypothetical protein
MARRHEQQTRDYSWNTRLYAILAGTSMLVLSSISPTHAWLKADLVRCSETGFEATTGVPCGGDDLTKGRIGVTPSGVVKVGVLEALAEPFNLYEVYWLPVGETVANAVFVGNFATDCNGNARTVLREIVTPADIRRGTVMNIFTEVGVPDAGVLLVYSRGPWGFDDADGDCRPDTFNTAPVGTDPTKPLANPTVDLTGDGVQFLSGYTN